MRFKRMKYTKETLYRILASGYYQGYQYRRKEKRFN